MGPLLTAQTSNHCRLVPRTYLGAKYTNTFSWPFTHSPLTLTHTHTHTHALIIHAHTNTHTLSSFTHSHTHSSSFSAQASVKIARICDEKSLGARLLDEEFSPMCFLSTGARVRGPAPSGPLRALIGRSGARRARARAFLSLLMRDDDKARKVTVFRSLGQDKCGFNERRMIHEHQTFSLSLSLTHSRTHTNSTHTPYLTVSL